MGSLGRARRKCQKQGKIYSFLQDTLFSPQNWWGATCPKADINIVAGEEAILCTDIQRCSPLGYEKVARTWQQGHSLQPTTSIPSWIVALSWQRGLHNWMKLWAKPCRATQDRQVTVKSSCKSWSNGGDNSKPLHYSCCENPMNRMKRQKRYDTWRWAP